MLTFERVGQFLVIFSTLSSKKVSATTRGRARATTAVENNNENGIHFEPARVKVEADLDDFVVNDDEEAGYDGGGAFEPAIGWDEVMLIQVTMPLARLDPWYFLVWLFKWQFN